MMLLAQYAEILQPLGLAGIGIITFLVIWKIVFLPESKRSRDQTREAMRMNVEISTKFAEAMRYGMEAAEIHMKMFEAFSKGIDQNREMAVSLEHSLQLAGRIPGRDL